jgi:nucleotide-binding universal stress UspA family protein
MGDLLWWPSCLAGTREHDADLVVVGSRSHRLTERVFLGSVASEILQAAERPVLVQRLEPDPDGAGERCVTACRHTLERLLLATDLSDQSAAAEDAAVLLADRAGPVDCLVVVDGGVRGAATVTVDHAQSAAAAIVERITAAGGKGTVRIDHGDPQQRIPSIAAEGYSMVVIGKHGRGRVPGGCG